MTGCSCPHSVIEHGTAELFGTSMCLVPDCDCDGTHEELEAERAMRRTLPQSLLLGLCAKYIPDMNRAQALTAEICAEFALEPR